MSVAVSQAAVVPPPYEFLRTGDGGAGTFGSDLWATYAAIRTLRWIGRLPDLSKREHVAGYLHSCQNPDGSFSWQRGLASDIWATFYCSQTLADIGHSVAPREPFVEWMSSLQDKDGAFAMMPGQTADVWATYYATRVFKEILQLPVPNRHRLADWLSGLQRGDGGLAWNIATAETDTRAAYYAIHAKHAAGLNHDVKWDDERLLGWLQSQQAPSGGFRFSPEYAPCLWATFRATKALTIQNWQPSEPEACENWIVQRQRPDGFARWEDYEVSDVWANFSAVGALQALNVTIKDSQKDRVQRAIESFSVDGAGYTYRQPSAAGDALTTASALFSAVNKAETDSVEQLSAWLQRAHMPWEDGIMYMPGRGAEIRCSLWATAALAYAGRRFSDIGRLSIWISKLQNPDGGFGYWQGRGSDLVSTSAAISALDVIGESFVEHVDVARLTSFILSCISEGLGSNVPNGPITTSSTAQASRLLVKLGDRDGALSLLQHLPQRMRLSGYVEQLGGPPTLYATYQTVLAFQANGLEIPAQISRFLDRLITREGYIGWTPLGASRQDPLILPLHGLLSRKLGEPVFRLPELVL
ncbi:prenyltransferase/squalene oxidase repeat-containing protein [Agrobacterium vitis]|uniref:prenyltransferase/squalene oxidase repeat-containing protein n=1 Tax=Agrobacterium vitis TaxID=373 RepID=UPI0012E7404E|nr:prenyltransferase/squalene oxidase repeat-containing protein [Agrobacterium vitis]MVA36357.1 prenyltransferase [Agrobacterium vitis]